MPTRTSKSIAAAELSRRDLNRATLARQFLLQRTAMPALGMIEHLVGLQAQTPQTWYVGLWNRLEGFRGGHVSDLLERRQAVRMALMRSTIHLVTAEDGLWLRPLVQPVIERSTNGAFGQKLAGLDRDELAAAGRACVDERPLTFSELGARLRERWPDRDAAAMAQAVRARVPLVQVPPRGLWGRSGPIEHTSVESWLGRPVAADPSPATMVLRYLAAFGPATVRDVQAWSGLTRLAEVVDRLRTELVTFRDGEGRELFDLPDAPRPDPGTPAPARLLYDYDNLLLSHADRRRFVTDDYRARGEEFIASNVMPSIVLVDGFTAGTWKVLRQRGTAKLAIQPFTGRLPEPVEAALTTEGAGLLHFLAPDDSHEIEFVASDAPWIGLPASGRT
jgi:hypothetical protein